MAFYTYKLVCHVIPDRYVDEAFEQKYGEKFDGDANYDGDYWVAASDWIDDLQKEAREANRLRAGLETIRASLDEDVEFYEQWGDEINGHAANALKIVGDYIRELLEDV